MSKNKLSDKEIKKLRKEKTKTNSNQIVRKDEKTRDTRI